MLKRMLVKIFGFVLIIVLVCGSVPGLNFIVDRVYAAAPLGTGTAADPYIISTPEDLVWVSNSIASYSNLYFKQVNNIDMSGVEFTPIGSSTKNFNGYYDGCGRSISNLTINTSSIAYVGLFGFVSSPGIVKNIDLVNANLITTMAPATVCIGGVVGWGSGTIQNVSVSGAIESITGTSSIGGIIGQNYGKVENCYSSAKVTGHTASCAVGGIAGYTGDAYGYVKYCYSIGVIDAAETANNGGIVGNYYNGAVTDNYFLDTTAIFGIGSESSNLGAAPIAADKMLEEGTYTGWSNSIWYFNDRVAKPVLKSPTPYASDIIINRKPDGVNDTITVSKRVAGETVNVYDAAVGGVLLGSAIVADGQTSVEIDIGKLTEGSGSFYIAANTEFRTQEGGRQQISYTVPAAPTGLTSTAGYKQVSLNWSPVAGATSYKVYQGTKSGEYDSTPVCTVAAPTTTAAITGLTNDSAYYYVVKAFLNNFDSAASNETSAVPSLPSPANLSAAVDDSTITLYWNDVPGVDNYDVYYGTSSGEYGIPESVIGTSTTITGLENGTAYYFAVKSNIDGNVSGYSEEISAIPAPFAFSIPITVPFISNGLPTGWETANLDASPPATPLQWSIVSIGADDHDPDLLPHSGGYMAKVNSYDVETGQARLNMSKSVSVPANGSYVFSFYFYIDPVVWDAENKMTPLVSTDNGANWVPLGAAIIPQSATDGNKWVEFTYSLDAYKGMNIRLGLLAESAYGNNMYIDDISIARVLTAPAEPSDVTAVAGNGNAEVSFSVPEDDGGSSITGYTVVPYIGVDAQPLLAVSDVSSPITVTGLTNGTAYTFKVYSTNAIGDSSESTASNEVTPTALIEQAAVIYNDISKTYGDASFNHTATGGSGIGTFSYTSSDTDVAIIDPSTGNVTILKAGVTTLTATKAGDTQYYEANDTCTLTIDPAALTATATVDSKTYDSGTAGTGKINLSGLIDGDSTEVTASGTFTFENANAGTGKTVNVTGITLGGTKADDYTLSSTTAAATGDIIPKTLTATAAADNKTYDGNTAATGSINLDAVEGVDTGLVTASGTFAFEDANAGTGKTVNVTGITLGGAKAGNYTLDNTTATATADIGKADITGVSYDNAATTYDGTAKTLLLTGALPEGASVVYSDNIGTNAGTYNADAQITGGVNYNDKTLNATLTISKAVLTATVGNYTKTYGNANPDFAVEVTGFVNGETSETAAGYTAPTASSIATATTDTGLSVITISGGIATNYTFDITDTGTLTIEPKTLAVSAAADSKTYDGNTSTTGTVSLSGIEGVDTGLVTASGTFAFEDAGVGTGKTVNVTGITLGGAKAGNYILDNTTATATADIGKADITGVSYDNAATTYDGTAKTLLLTGALPEGASVVYSGNTGTTVGTYNATAQITGGANYNDETLNAALTISKAALTATVGNYTKTYGNANPDFAVEVTGFVNGETSETAAGYTAPTASSIATATTDTGSAAITISGGIATNYTFDITDTGILTIEPKTLTTSATADSKTYDGNTSTTGTVSLSGIEGVDTGLVTASGTFTFENADAGTGKTVNVTDIILLGAKAGNYTLDSTATTTGDIAPKILTATATADNKTYDGNTAATGNINLDAVEGADAGQVAASGTFAFEDANVGIGKTVNVTGITLAGAKAGNYTLDNTTATATADIGKADITGVSYDNAATTYDGTAKTLLLTGTLPEGASVVYSGNTGTNAGTYDATAQITGGANYNDEALNATLTISKAALTATVGNYTKTYGNANPDFAVEVTGFVNGETSETAAGYTAPIASSIATETTDVGSAAITTSGGIATNYTFDITDTGTLTIEPKTLTATATADSKTYDGNTSTTGTVSLSGIEGVDTGLVTASGTFTFESADAGAGNTVNVTDITLGGAKAGNYILGSTTATTNGDIAPKTLTATATADDKPFDGSNAATGTISLDGVIEGDDVTASGTFEFTDTTVGDSKTVNVTNITLGGDDAGNYILDNTTAATTADITKQVQSIEVTTLPDVTTYEYGEELNPDGGEITITYTDASLSTISLASEMCEVDDTPAIGNREVTVTYLGHIDTFEITYIKAMQTAPEAPECIATEAGITVTSPTGSVYEYSIDGGTNWQDSANFAGLTHATTYTIKVRLKETSTHNASDASVGTDVTFIDITAPSLTPVFVNRTSNTEAIVKFNSNEEGKYYYEVVGDGDAEPAINTSGEGEDCAAGDITINIALSEGARDVYIIVKDGAGNDSEALKIDIPAYVLTTAEKAVIDLDTLIWDDIKGGNDSADSVTKDIEFILTGKVYGSNISWESSDINVVNMEGKVTRPAFADGDAEITLTASISYDGTSIDKEFNITVLKGDPSSDADLSALSISGVALSPAFNSDVTSYSLSVDHGKNNITITPTTANSGAAATVNGNPLDEGSKKVMLSTGVNTITIEVTAQDGVTQNIYTVTVTRAAKSEDDIVTPPIPTPTPTPTPTPPPTLPPTPDPSTGDDGGSEIVLDNTNGVTETETTSEDGQTLTTVTVNEQVINEELESADNGSTVVIPVNSGSDVVTGELNGQTVKNMEDKDAVLEIKTENVTYTLSAAEINIDNVSSQIGEDVGLGDIKVGITIAEPPQDTAKVVEDTANKNNYMIVVKPVEFNITCTYADKKVDVSKFNGYVERTVAIPDGVDPSKITTGIILNSDGTFSHVPTTIIVIDGKYYAKINSLTNSVYSVIWNQVAFKDVENHWAKEIINDMGSRLIIDGIGDDKFEPDRDITRAEFAAIVVKALGLIRPGTGKDSFKDVAKDAWYYDAASIAYEYGIISGYGDGKFRPMDKITREQAMAMIARAMKLTGLKAVVTSDETDKLLAGFNDSEEAAEWAKDSIASCIDSEIVSGRDGKLIAPKENMTRAEVAAIVRRLLQKSELIN